MNLIKCAIQFKRHRWHRYFQVIGILVYILYWQPGFVLSQEWATSGTNIYNTNSGNVGIGTTIPNYRLDVNGGINIVSNNHLRFGVDQSYIKGNTTAVSLDIHGDDYIDFYADVAVNPLMRISYTGNVGIGITNPERLLHVARSATEGVNGDTLNSYEIAQFKVHSSGGGKRGLEIGAPTGNVVSPVYLKVHGTGNRFSILDQNNMENFVILEGGNVGIGTSSPTTKLHVDGGTLTVSHATNMDFITLNNAGTNGRIWRINSTSDGSIDGAGRFIIRDDTIGIGSVRLAIDSSGNVGIGTTIPNYRLNVNGAVNVVSNNNLRFGVDQSYIKGNTNAISLDIHGDDYIDFYADVAVNPLMRISYTGNVGIGTTNPQEQLHVAGNVRVDGNIAAKYQDVAEWVYSPMSVASGTVVVLDVQDINRVIPSSMSYDTRVAGVVNDTPGILLGESGDGKVKVATTGRVKVKADATHRPINVGDLLVTSDREGYAMRSEPLDLGGTPIHRPGTILGKALEPLGKGAGEILVLLTLQ